MEDYETLVKELRETDAYQAECQGAADAIEALLVERDAAGGEGSSLGSSQTPRYSKI